MNSKVMIKGSNATPTVIYAWDYLTWGGAQIHLFALIKEVRKELNVKVILPERSDAQLLKFVKDLNVNFDLIPTNSDSTPANTVLAKIKRHLTKLKTENALVAHLMKYDVENSILHVELAPWQSLLSLIRLSRRTRVFVTAHNALPPVPKWRYFLWKMKLGTIARFRNFHMFCSNQDTKAYFQHLFPREFAKNIKVTYTSVNPVEIDAALGIELDQDQLRRRFRIPIGKFIVLCVGQFIDRKGRWTFLEAAREVVMGHSDIAFVWISNSRPDADDLKKIDEYGLGDDFRLIISDEVGPERSDLLKMFRLADVFTLPSFVEGLPISLLEAMALGIPSISTNVYAIPEAVLHGETGILIEAGDSVALANAILRLKDNAKLREKLSNNGRTHVLEHFDERAVAKIALESYKDSLGAK